MAAALPDAFAGMEHSAIAAVAPASAPASSVIPPLDLTQLGDFQFSNASSGSAGTFVVQGPSLFAGNVAFVDAGTLTTGGYTVSAGTFQGMTSAQGGATAAIANGANGSPIGDSTSLLLNFRQDASNHGTYLLSLNRLNSSSTGEITKLTLGDVKVLGWNSDSILLTTNATPGGQPIGDIVISTTDMSATGGVPTNTTFTTTGPAPVVLGVTVPEVPCFAAGTEIATPDGPRAVEDLDAGDLVCTQGGGVARISWVGSRIVNCNAHPAPKKVLPVRIRRHAFGANLPRRDLVLSPDHAIFLGGVLIPVCELINGQNVVQERVHTVRYVHIELPLHDIVLAEGLPCESFLDIGNHSQFGEGDGAMPLHPDFAATALAWEAACAPLCLQGPEVDAARALLATQQARAA
jgi:hypothetical protein